MCAEASNGGTAGPARYSLTVHHEEARSGTSRILTRHNKRLEVKVPAEARNGQVIRLRNALQVTDGQQGDILVRLIVRSGPGDGEVNVVTDGTFETEVLNSPVPVLVDFWAPWCGPCKAVAPITERLARDYLDRIKVCKLNVDENPLAAKKYQIASIPTVLLFNGGRIADMSVGAVSADDLRNRVEKVLSDR